MKSRHYVYDNSGYEPFPCDWMSVNGGNLLVGSIAKDNEEIKVIEYRSDLKSYIVSSGNWSTYRKKKI